MNYGHVIGGEDYDVISSLNVNFTNASVQAEMCGSVNILDDSILETVENFNIVLISTNADFNLINGRVTINDNDCKCNKTATIKLLILVFGYLDVDISVPDSFLVEENNGIVEVCATLQTNLTTQKQVIINLSVKMNEGSAIGMINSNVVTRILMRKS